MRAKPWDTLTELVAQAVDELGVLAADRRRKEPTEVERPGWLRPKGASGMDRAFAVLLATSNVIT